MNIIEAIQAAENGHIITNEFLKYAGNHYLKYIENGVFFEYEHNPNGGTEEKGSGDYKYEIRDFNTAYVLTTSWEIVTGETFEDKNLKDELETKFDDGRTA